MSIVVSICHTMQMMCIVTVSLHAPLEGRRCVPEMAEQAVGMVLRVDSLQITINGYHVDFMTVHW